MWPVASEEGWECGILCRANEALCHFYQWNIITSAKLHTELCSSEDKWNQSIRYTTHIIPIPWQFFL
jgi:hypothetical protein